MKTISLFLSILLMSFSMGWLNYTDSNMKFNIQYPETWERQVDEGIAIFLSPKENEMDLFQTNVNVVLQKRSGSGLTLEEYTKSTKEQVLSHCGQDSIESEADITLSGFNGKELIYKMRHEGIDLKIRQAWILKMGEIYLITYTATTTQFESQIHIFDEMLASFRLVN